VRREGGAVPRLAATEAGGDPWPDEAVDEVVGS
jgi:hypothetical protein